MYTTCSKRIITGNLVMFASANERIGARGNTAGGLADKLEISCIMSAGISAERVGPQRALACLGKVIRA